jgi:hypothetical protein
VGATQESRAVQGPGVIGPAALIVLGHATLALALLGTDGHEDPYWLLLVIGAVAAWAKALQGAVRGVPPGVDGARPLLWLVALGSAMVSLFVFWKPPGAYVETSVVPFLVLDGCAVLVLATYGLDVALRRELPRAFVVARTVSLFGLALAIGAWMLHASPNPKIDLFPMHQQAAEAMLAGRSLYEPGVVHTLETFRNQTPIEYYVYLPLPACLTTVAYALTHDMRWAQLVAQLVSGFLLWLTARRVHGPSGGWADLLAAAFLFHPRGPFVLEEGWTEPLAIPFLGGFVLLALARRPVWASVCLGLLCAMKQHMFLYAPFLALVPGVGLSGLVIAGGVALLTVAPFALRSPYGFYRGVFDVFHNPFRTDALTIPAELARIGFITPSWVGFVAALAPIAWLTRIPRTLAPLLLGSCVCFGLFYVLGRQAFCNYYYLLDATVLFAAATLAK